MNVSVYLKGIRFLFADAPEYHFAKDFILIIEAINKSI